MGSLLLHHNSPPDPIPIVLYGEGNYALTDIKQIQVTPDFLALGRDVRNCEEEEEYNKCIMRKYGEEIIRKCNCTPLSLKPFFTQVYNLGSLFY